MASKRDVEAISTEKQQTHSILLIENPFFEDAMIVTRVAAETIDDLNSANAIYSVAVEFYEKAIRFCLFVI